MKISPLQVFLLYLTVVVFCAVAYYLVPGIFSIPITIVDSFYFSVVTITTLGYGDLSPVSDFGKILSAAEAFFGVILLGLFLLAVANQIADAQERKRIHSGKENLKAQYKIWREEVVMSLLFLCNPGCSVSSKLMEELVEPSKFRDHFSENNNKRWYAIANNLSKDDYYTIEILRGLETLQHHIQIFITIIPINDANILQKLTNFVNYLNRMKRIDMDHYDDQKSFLRNLWSIIALWDFETGEYDRNHIIETINEV